MSELLGQNVGLIFRFLERAITEKNAGEPWKALELLGDTTTILYHSADKEAEEKLYHVLGTLEAIRALNLQIKGVNEEATRDARLKHLNDMALKVFVTEIQIIRDYMQIVGYYEAMLKTWVDLSGGRSSA